MRYNVIFTRLLGLPAMYSEALDSLKEKFPKGVAPPPPMTNGRKKSNRKDTNPPHDLPRFSLPEGKKLIDLCLRTQVPTKTPRILF